MSYNHQHLVMSKTDGALAILTLNVPRKACTASMAGL